MHSHSVAVRGGAKDEGLMVALMRALPSFWLAK
jgi:hypothetical protein